MGINLIKTSLHAGLKLIGQGRHGQARFGGRR